MKIFNRSFRKHNINEDDTQSSPHVKFLDKISFLEKNVKDNISWQLIERSRSSNLTYLSLAEALDTKKITINEISESGNVPNLSCTNHSDEYVLILPGEEIIGAKQNRIINISIIIKPKSDVIIPVSCVEEGRWSYKSRSFSKGFSAYTDLKRKVMEDVVMCNYNNSGYQSNQSRVWDDINQKEVFFNKRSNTGAMHELYEDTESDFNDFINNFNIDNASGICIYINDYLAGIDIFPNKIFFKNIPQDLLRCYFIEALRYKNNNDPYSTFEKSEYFLKYL